MKTIVLLLLGTLIAGCVTVGHTFSVSGLSSIKPGMSETKVVSLLKAEPDARNTYANGTYLLQWMYVHGTPVGGNSKHVALLFGSDHRLLRVVEQSSF